MRTQYRFIGSLSISILLSALSFYQSTQAEENSPAIKTIPVITENSSISHDMLNVKTNEVNDNFAKEKWTLSTLTPSLYSQLDLDQQMNIASMWNLSISDYKHYLYLINRTVNGVYYKDRNLDPSWILGFNAKNEAERKKYVIIAIQNERLRVAKELAFQQDFTKLQKELYPTLQPIRWK